MLYLFNIVDDDIDEQSRVDETIFYRSASCNLLSTDIVCDICHHLESIETKCFQKKKRNMLTPAKLNAPVSATAPEKIVLALRQQRNDIKDQKVKIEELQYEIKKHSVTVTPDLHTDLQDIFNNYDKRKISPFMKLFWEEQLKSINMSASQVRYHPMIIKFCLALYAKSPAAYDHLRFNEKEGTGCIILPSKNTLKDYRNYIHPKTGFNGNIVKDLAGKTKMFSNSEKFVAISFDEMKVQEDLVWNKHTGELVGFVDLGDVELNHAVLNKVDSLATHVLVIMVRSIVNPLSYTFATFATSGISSYEFSHYFGGLSVYLKGHVG